MSQFYEDLPNSHDFNVLKGEAGISIGFAQYIGDINPIYNHLYTDYTLGVFYKKFFNSYIGYRLQLNYARLNGNDQLSNNVSMQTRNLNFQSDVGEFIAAIDVHFFRFTPKGYFNTFTPYLTFGLGGIYFNSHTTLDGQRYNLRFLHTETDNNYLPITATIPFGLGIKFNINQYLNIEIEALHRFTLTDRLDDVSGEYRGRDAFEENSVALQLQDRSVELDITPIGQRGRQRGNSNGIDMFQSLNIKFSFNLYKYQCP